MKKILKALGKSKLIKTLAPVIPGGNLIKNVISPKGGEGEWDGKLVYKDLSIDLFKLGILVAALGVLLGWWTPEDAEAAKELLGE